MWLPPVLIHFNNPLLSSSSGLFPWKPQKPPQNSGSLMLRRSGSERIGIWQDVRKSEQRHREHHLTNIWNIRYGAGLTMFNNV
jgi:hypothetical protein